MSIKWIGPYPPVPSRRPSEEGTPSDGHEARQRDGPSTKKERAKFRNCLTRWAENWGADLLMIWGAGCLSAGVGWIYPPAGLIAVGAFLIAGGVLWARGKGGDGP